MDTFRSRLPSRSVLFGVFVSCAIPVHFWADYNVFREVPAWILRMNVWELVGVIAYTQTFALFETSLLASFFILMAIVLPTQWMREHLVALSAVLMLIVSVWLVVLHYNSNWIESRNAQALGVWAASLLVALISVSVLAKRSEPFRSSTNDIVNRLTVLAALFVLIDVLSLVVVFARNVSL